MSLCLNTEIEIREQEPLHLHSSFKIGGPAKYALFPKNREELLTALSVVIKQGIPFRVIGNGSNMLFDDKGFDGAIIFTKRLNDLEYTPTEDGAVIRVGCGRSLAELSGEVGRKMGLTGLEFACGIPGTVGGAVFMNAGAYGGQMSDIVRETEYYDIHDEQIKCVTGDGHLFDYRHSLFAEHPEYVILSTTLCLKKGDPEEILAMVNKNKTARRERQPSEPSAGSTFKRPGGGLFAGKLIEDAGLKGYAVGGAVVSHKHAGFTVNAGDATCADVLAVMKHTRDTVKELFGVTLESEIIYLPYN